MASMNKLRKLGVGNLVFGASQGQIENHVLHNFVATPFLKNVLESFESGNTCMEPIPEKGWNVEASAVVVEEGDPELTYLSENPDVLVINNNLAVTYPSRRFDEREFVDWIEVEPKIFGYAFKVKFDSSMVSSPNVSSMGIFKLDLPGDMPQIGANVTISISEDEPFSFEGENGFVVGFDSSTDLTNAVGKNIHFGVTNTDAEVGEYDQLKIVYDNLNLSSFWLAVKDGSNRCVLLKQDTVYWFNIKVKLNDYAKTQLFDNNMNAKVNIEFLYPNYIPETDDTPLPGTLTAPTYTLQKVRF
jgi:hypothetical protein